MQLLGKRGLLLLALGLLAVPVGAAGVAYACTALATISTSTTSAVAGGTITVSGKYFAPHDPNDIRTTPAIVRMDRVDGPALAQASPTGNSDGGGFSVNITVPRVDAGDHVLIVTQNGIDGRPAYGTPARTILTVEPAPVAAATAAAPAPAPAAVTMPAPFPANAKPAAKPRMTRAARIAKCKSRFKLTAAKTKQGRKRIAARRASCVRVAIRLTA